MTHACMGPYTSERSNMTTKYSRFLTVNCQGRKSSSLRRNRVEFRARVTSTSLALEKTEIRFGKIREANEQPARPKILVSSQHISPTEKLICSSLDQLNPSHYLAMKNALSISCPLFIGGKR